MNSNFFFYLSKISVQVLWDFAFFPVWWYSVGLLRFLTILRNFLAERWMVIGAGVWLKNIFTPMYGQRDFASRAISFFIRLFQIIFRFIAFIFFILLTIVAVLIWLALPIVIVYLIIEKIF